MQKLYFLFEHDFFVFCFIFFLYSPILCALFWASSVKLAVLVFLLFHFIVFFCIFSYMLSQYIAYSSYMFGLWLQRSGECTYSFFFFFAMKKSAFKRIQNNKTAQSQANYNKCQSDGFFVLARLCKLQIRLTQAH